MAKVRIAMRKIKEVLRLGFEKGLSMNAIARCCRMGRTTVQEYFRRFKLVALDWSLVKEADEETLEKRLFPQDTTKHASKAPLNYEYLAQEIKKKNMTMEVLWEEYKKEHPEGYQYAQFCNLYRAYRKTLNCTMRQEHKAGEKVFADFGKGDGIKLIDPKTGNLISVNVFVDVWGASNYTFAKAVVGEETLENWFNCSAESFEYFGCCPKAFVPDNPKSVVSKACRYEPDINPSFAEFGQHYDVTIFPARPGKAKDKAKVEAGVKLAKRWILARLRNRVFYSLKELNDAIFGLLERLNNKQMKRQKKSRRELFEILDKPVAQLLPQKTYRFAQWKKVRVNIDYHIEFDQHYYSVPYTLIGQQLEIRITSSIIEVFRRGKRICSHKRSYSLQQRAITVPDHMPKSHREHLEWTPSRILAWAGKYGVSVRGLVDKIMAERTFAEQGYRRCLGIIRLGQKHSAEKLNRACERALRYHAYSYNAVKNILMNGLEDLEDATAATKDAPVIKHENIRGSEYYLTERESIFSDS